MKAALVVAPGVLQVREVPDPQPGEYEALCRLLYGATCTGTDQHLISGQFPGKLPYPFILGHESVGRVIRVGPRVRHLKEGDLITRVGAPPSDRIAVRWGGFAQFGIACDHRAMREDGLPQAQWNRCRVQQVLPPEVDPAAATLVVTWRETLSYLRRMGVGAGSRLLILGSGGNGLAFAAHAVNHGAAYVAMTGNAARASAAQSVGVHGFFDYADPKALEAAAAAAPGGYDFIIDAVGKQGMMDAALRALKPGGTIGIYGMDDWEACCVHPRRAGMTFTCYGGRYDEEEAHEPVMQDFLNHRLKPECWLDLNRPFALDRIQDAFEAVRQRRLVKALVKL